jgi:hypothetical protein
VAVLASPLSDLCPLDREKTENDGVCRPLVEPHVGRQRNSGSGTAALRKYKRDEVDAVAIRQSSNRRPICLGAATMPWVACGHAKEDWPQAAVCRYPGPSRAGSADCPDCRATAITMAVGSDC